MVTEELESKVPKDKGWAWVIVGAGMLNMFVINGISFTFGILFIAIENKFHSGATLSATIFSIIIMMRGIGGAVVLNILPGILTFRAIIMTGAVLYSLGLLLSSFAPNAELLIFTTGIMLGIGSAFCYGTSIAVLKPYFQKYHSLSVALVYAGGNIGQAALPFVLHLLLNSYGLSGTYLILSGIALNTVACAALIRPTSFYERKSSNMIHDSQTVSFGKKMLVTLKSWKVLQKSGENSALLTKKETIVCSKDFKMEIDCTDVNHDVDKSQSQGKGQMQTLATVLRCKISMLLTLADSIELSSSTYFLAFLPSFAIECGMNEENAGSLLFVSALGEVIAGPLYGYISSVSRFSNYYLLSVCELSSGILTMALPLWGQPSNLIWLSLLNGIFFAKFFQTLPSFFVQELDSEMLPSAIGVQLLMEGIAMTVFGPVLGWLKDYTGSFTVTFFTLGAMQLCSLVILAFVSLLKKFMDTRKQIS